MTLVSRVRGRLRPPSAASALRAVGALLVALVAVCSVAGADIDGFERRRAQAFARGLELAQKLPPEPKRVETSRTSQQPDWRRWAIPRFQVAFLQLQAGRDVTAANALIVTTCRTLLADTGRYTGGPSGLHWSVSPILRTYFLFGPGGRQAPDRLSAEARAALEELLFCWVDQETRIDEADPRRVWESWASENHSAMRRGLAWGASAILAQAAAYREREFADGFRPAERHAAETAYARRWLSEHGQRGLLVEIASGSYSAVTLQNWYNYRDFAADPELRRLAEQLLHLWWADCAQELLDGVRGGSKAREGRGRGDDWNGHAGANAALSWYYLGTGQETGPHLNTYLALLTSDYRLPAVIADLATDVAGRGSYVYESRRPGLAVPQYTLAPQPQAGRALHSHFHWVDRERGGIRRYTFVTPDYILGGSMVADVPAERWTGISASNRWSGAVLRGHPDARVFAQCDVDAPDRYGNARGANEHGTLQETRTLVWKKLRASRNHLGTRVYFPALLQPQEEQGVVFGRSGQAFVAARVGAGGWKREDERWLRLEDEYAPVILECGSAAEDGSFEDFKRTVLAGRVSRDGEALHYVRARDGRRFTVFPESDRAGEIDGRAVDLEPPFTYRSPFIRAAWPAEVVTIEKGGRRLELDFRIRSD